MRRAGSPSPLRGEDDSNGSPVLTFRPVGHCRRCPSILLPKRVWSGIAPGDRKQLAVAFARHQGRRLCSACWETADKTGELLDYDRVHLTAEERADNWLTYRDELPHPAQASTHARLQAAARRDDCHPDTIKRALQLQGVTP